VKELEANIFNMRFQFSMGKLENTAQIRSARREIALAKTVLKQNAKKAKA
jgi:ribosomal protein L29